MGRRKAMADRDFFTRSLNSRAQQNFSQQVFRRAFTNGRFRPGGVDTHREAMAAIWMIITANGCVFGLWQYANYTKDNRLRQWLNTNFTLSLKNYFENRSWTALTAAFSHTDLVHFAFNMLALHAFASILSWVPGIGAMHVQFLCLGSAVAASYAWLKERQWGEPRATFTSDKRMVPPVRPAALYTTGLGASGMVMGAGAAAACLMPLAPMRIMGVIPAPLWAVTLGFAAVDTYFLHTDSKVGHSAHLGGSIFGLVYYAVFLRWYGGIWQMIRMRR